MKKNAFSLIELLVMFAHIRHPGGNVACAVLRPTGRLGIRMFDYAFCDGRLETLKAESTTGSSATTPIAATTGSPL